jgi:signal recognition particle receptor subunit beta
MISHKMMRHIPFTVVANKQDKRGSVSVSAIRKQFKLDKSVGVTQRDSDVPHVGMVATITRLLEDILARYERISVKRHRNR